MMQIARNIIDVDNGFLRGKGTCRAHRDDVGTYLLLLAAAVLAAQTFKRPANA